MKLKRSDFTREFGRSNPAFLRPAFALLSLGFYDWSETKQGSSIRFSTRQRWVHLGAWFVAITGILNILNAVWPNEPGVLDLKKTRVIMRIDHSFTSEKRRTILTIVLTFCLLALSGVGAFLLLCQWWVYEAGDNRIFKSADDVPENEVGLVLGTAKWLGNGKLNRFFSFRMDAACRLYRSGKVGSLLLSGNGLTPGRGEPEQMRNELIARGIPADVLKLDNGGIRTLDSIVRAKRVYGLNQLTIVSQEFHNRRALFFCRAYGIDAVGFNAEDVPTSEALRTFLRESLARVDAVLEITLARPRP
jgi:SanA protein